MNARTKILTNCRFNKLVVISYSHSSKYGQTYWLCRCYCGNTKIVRRSHLVDGTTKSCGCLGREQASKRLKLYATSSKHKGLDNPAWKGDAAGLSSIHSWVGRYYQKEKCEKCSNKKNLDWALKKGKKYSHCRDNFMVLCRSCHLKYDYTDERRNKIATSQSPSQTKQTRGGYHAEDRSVVSEELPF